MATMMAERMERERILALYGDSPPPARQPAPYPDGEIISQFGDRYVVRQGTTITKYTKRKTGMGANDHPNEALALRYIKENTSIPVPEVISSDWDRITMEYIEGQTLRDAWPDLTPDQRAAIMDQLRGYISQMRAIPGNFIGRLDHQGVIIPSFVMRSGGPFANMAELHEWLVRPPHRLDSESMYWHQITTKLGSANYRIVLSHGDIAARNIMVRDGRIVAILDWEYAGWYPEYWDYAFTISGLDNVDWETLGSRIPGLFDQRYDDEYILMRFIVSLS